MPLVRTFGIALGTTILVWWLLAFVWPSHKPQWPIIGQLAVAVGVWIGAVGVVVLIARAPGAWPFLLAAFTGVIGWFLGWKHHEEKNRRLQTALFARFEQERPEAWRAWREWFIEDSTSPGR